MQLLSRPSPEGKKVSLFVTCMIDMLHPHLGWSTVELLEHLGLEVDFPMEQTCCGQPGFNAGHRPEARAVARQFLLAFRDSEVIVTPSGSCAAMVRHEYPRLFAERPEVEEARRIGSLTWELSEFLVHGLGVVDLGLGLPETSSFAFHDACHGLRLLGLGKAARELFTHTENAEWESLEGADECCGFGGLFSVKMADVSGAMLDRKIENIEACPASTIVCGDVSCMVHMNGGLERRGSDKRVRHFADVLAQGLRNKPQ